MSPTSELLERLLSLDRARLLDLWHTSFGQPASPRLRREPMLPILAFRIQELAHGGLKPETKAQLREITASLTSTGQNHTKPRFKAGTRLVREWRGKVHEVLITANGFEYLGETYKSLSRSPLESPVPTGPAPPYSVPGEGRRRDEGKQPLRDLYPQVIRRGPRTAMGRLTLNVLLSFAQFDREVTGERIRDKVAASKKKGMWMGGIVPLGYDHKDKQLRVNEAEAKQVRHIFDQYLRLGSVFDLNPLLQRTRNS